MGRWGHRLFEGDQDLDVALEINQTFSDRPIKLSHMVHQTDMMAPAKTLEFYKTDKYKAKLDRIVTKIRKQLDTGLGDRIFEKQREGEATPAGKYRLILTGALMIRAGAKIRAEQIQHLRDLVPRIPCSVAYTLPIFDAGFREPGRAQLLAALDNYVAGTPRSFQEPSCFTCGKIEADLGFAPKECGRCKKAWYCSEECQRAQWSSHKQACKSPNENRSLNV